MAIKSNVRKRKMNETKAGVALRLKQHLSQSVSVKMRIFGEIDWVDV